MKVRELTKETMMDVPDEWGEVVNRLKEIMPDIKKAANTDNSVYITLHEDGSFSITVNNFNKAKEREEWTIFCECGTGDGYVWSYASKYIKEGE